VLARCSGVVQVVFGTVLTGRMQGAEGVNNAVGFFINTLPLRLDLDDTATESALRRVHASLAELFTYENASLGLALRCSGVAALAPLFSSTLNYRNYSTSQLPESRTENMLAGMEFRRGERHSNYPVAISFDDLGHSLITHLDVVQTLSAERVHSYFQQCLESLAHALENDPHMPVQQLEILTPEERQQLVEEWNATEVDFGVDGCVHELFERQVEQTPDRVAVEYGSKEITYRELDHRANQLARYLRKQGVGPEMVVGIWVERSAEMVVGVMGILKAGAAYMPLDGNYPEERLEYMIEDAQVSLMLVGKEQEKRMPRVWVPVVVMDGEEREWEREEEERVESGVCGGNLAYVIYTSGSTGKPKGVGVEHRQLANYIQAIGEKMQIEVGMRLALVSTYAADLGYTMIFPALCHGGCLDVVAADWVLDAGKLTQHFSQHPIDYLKIVPSHLQALLGSSPGSGVLPRRWLVVGGEASNWELIRQVKERRVGCRVLNHYGPTETTVGILTYDTTQESEGERARGMVPLGKPLSNGKIYVLDKELNPVPVGVRGEIYIGGVGLARGYVNRAEMTAERFVPNPFSARGGERLYRTGDVGRYGEDGNIEFVGRRDEQVKIRGYRIELGEIEARLKEHGLVEEAVVVAREAGEDGGGEKRLVAYVVMVKRTKKDEEENRIPEGGKLEAAELSTTLRTYLAKWLPEYMVPTAIVGVERIPLTANGKVDRKALPAPEGEAYAQGSYEPPQGEMEEILANLWQELLGVERVGRLDNFFELGGHSLLGVRLLARIWKAFGVELPITILFTRPRLEQLTQAVKEARSAGEQPLLPMTPISRQQPIPLSYAQQRLWFMEQLEPGQATYNMPFGLRLKGKLNADALENSLGEVIRRHEVLRTRFVEQSGELVQQVEDWRRIKLERVDLMGKEEGKREEEVRRRAEEEEIRGFDLRQGPLIRAVLMRVDEDEHVLLLTLHHIVSDGWSGEILVREMTELYGAYVEKREPQLGEIKIQYGDYAVWQRKWLRGEILEKQLKYWREQLAGLEVLELASDRVRPEGASHSGERLRFELDEGLSEDLKEISRREGVTVFMTLLAAFQVLLGLWTGQEDIVVGTDVANRNRLETQGLIGFFVNQLVLRTDLKGGPSFREVLRRVREMTLGAYAHQDVPFEKLVQDIGANRDIRRNPFFEVKFVLQSEMEVVMLPGLTITSVSDSGALRSAKLDMTLFMEERQGSLRGILEYRTSKFTRSRMLGFVEQYQRILRQVSDAMDTEIHLLAAASLAEPVMLSAFQQAPK
jgi:amino acid adenylation domain-containing protein